MSWRELPCGCFLCVRGFMGADAKQRAYEAQRRAWRATPGHFVSRAQLVQLEAQLDAMSERPQE